MSHLPDDAKTFSNILQTFCQLLIMALKMLSVFIFLLGAIELLLFT